MSENAKQIRARVQHKHKTEAQWILDVYTDSSKTTLRDNPFVPLAGELIIFDKDENNQRDRFKFGDGETNVMELLFASVGGDLQTYGGNLEYWADTGDYFGYWHTPSLDGSTNYSICEESPMWIKYDDYSGEPTKIPEGTFFVFTNGYNLGTDEETGETTFPPFVNTTFSGHYITLGDILYVKNGAWGKIDSGSSGLYNYIMEKITESTEKLDEKLDKKPNGKNNLITSENKINTSYLPEELTKEIPLIYGGSFCYYSVDTGDFFPTEEFLATIGSVGDSGAYLINSDFSVELYDGSGTIIEDAIKEGFYFEMDGGSGPLTFGGITVEEDDAKYVRRVGDHWEETNSTAIEIVVVNTVNGQSGDVVINTNKDWNQNDPQASDYIKNRTHYEGLSSNAIIFKGKSGEKQPIELLWSVLPQTTYALHVFQDEDFSNPEISLEETSNDNGEVVFFDNANEIHCKIVGNILTWLPANDDLLVEFYAEIVGPGKTVKQLDPKYIPPVSELGGIEAVVNDKDGNAVPLMNAGKSYIDGYKKYTADATPGTLVYRDGTGGRFFVNDATANQHPVAKHQMDEGLATKVTKNTSEESKQTVYITDPKGNQSYKKYTSEAYPSTIAHREASLDTIAVADPLFDAHPVTVRFGNERYFPVQKNSKLKPFAIFIYQESVFDEETGDELTFEDQFNLWVELNLKHGQKLFTDPQVVGKFDTTNIITIIPDPSAENISNAKNVICTNCSYYDAEGNPKVYSVSPGIRVELPSGSHIYMIKGNYGSFYYRFSNDFAASNIYPDYNEGFLSDIMDGQNYGATITFYDVADYTEHVTSSVMIQDPQGNPSYKSYTSGPDLWKNGDSYSGDYDWKTGKDDVNQPAKGSVVTFNKNGYFNVPNPQNSGHPINKGYADNRYLRVADYIDGDNGSFGGSGIPVVNGNNGHLGDDANAIRNWLKYSSGPNSASDAGADGDTSTYAGKLVRFTESNGRFNVADPTGSLHPVNKRTMEKYVKENSGSNVQADWNQNNSTEKDYIKNKTHYVEFSSDSEVIYGNGYDPVLDATKIIAGSTNQEGHFQTKGFRLGKYVITDIDEDVPATEYVYQECVSSLFGGRVMDISSDDPYINMPYYNDVLYFYPLENIKQLDAAFVPVDNNTIKVNGSGKLIANITDTKNTTGAANTSSKIYLVGATSQSANPVTYTHDTVYVDRDGCLYSDKDKVVTEKIIFDENKKIKMSSLPDTILGQMKFGGTIADSYGYILNPSKALSEIEEIVANGGVYLLDETNSTPTIITNNGISVAIPEGFYFIISGIDGKDYTTIGGIDFDTGDWAVVVDKQWEKVDNTDTVKTVNGQIGNVVLNLAKNWNENDPTSSEYIENRTHYSAGIVEEDFIIHDAYGQTLTINDSAQFPITLTLNKVESDNDQDVYEGSTRAVISSFPDSVVITSLPIEGEKTYGEVLYDIEEYTRDYDEEGNPIAGRYWKVIKTNLSAPLFEVRWDGSINSYDADWKATGKIHYEKVQRLEPKYIPIGFTLTEIDGKIQFNVPEFMPHMVDGETLVVNENFQFESTLPLYRGAAKNSICTKEATALTEDSFAAGTSLAGCRGCYIKAYDFMNKRLFLSKTQVAEPEIAERYIFVSYFKNYEYKVYVDGTLLSPIKTNVKIGDISRGFNIYKTNSKHVSIVYPNISEAEEGRNRAVLFEDWKRTDLERNQGQTKQIGSHSSIIIQYANSNLGEEYMDDFIQYCKNNPITNNFYEDDIEYEWDEPNTRYFYTINNLHYITSGDTPGKCDATISAMSGNRVTWIGDIGYDRVMPDDQLAFYDYSFMIPDFPDAFGCEYAVNLKPMAMAIGTGNKTIGRLALTFGNGNTALQDYGFAGGSGSSANYMDFSFGSKNVANGQYGAVIGGKRNVIKKGSHSAAIIGGVSNTIETNAMHSFIAAGNSNQIRKGASNAFVAGGGLTANAAEQTVLGRYNVPDAYKLFILGGGSEDSPRNVFTIDDSGDVIATGIFTAGRETNSMDNALTLVTKSYVDGLKTRITQLENIINSITALNVVNTDGALSIEE